MSVNDLLYAPDKPSGHDYRFVLWPQQWAAYNLSDLFNWEIYPFQQNQIKEIPKLNYLGFMPRCRNVSTKTRLPIVEKICNKKAVGVPACEVKPILF